MCVVELLDSDFGGHCGGEGPHGLRRQPPGRAGCAQAGAIHVQLSDAAFAASTAQLHMVSRLVRDQLLQEA